MSNNQDDKIMWLFAVIAAAIVSFFFLLKQIVEFTENNPWIHAIFMIALFAISTFAWFATKNDIRNGNLRIDYGWHNLWKPVVCIVCAIIGLHQSWLLLLNYIWLIYIPFGIIAIAIIFLTILGINKLIKYYKNKKRDTESNSENGNDS